MQVLAELRDEAIPFSVDEACSVELTVEQLEDAPLVGVGFAPLPAEAAQAKSYDRWGQELSRCIRSCAPITLFESKVHKLTSRPGESEREFRMRLADLGREARDAEADRLRKKYATRFRTAEDRVRRAEQAVEKRSSQAKQA